MAHRQEHVDNVGTLGNYLLWSVLLIMRPQLRFERHQSVHKLLLNMWGWQGYRRNVIKLLAAQFLQDKTSCFSSFRSPHTCLCMYSCESYLSCEAQLPFNFIFLFLFQDFTSLVTGPGTEVGNTRCPSRPRCLMKSLTPRRIPNGRGLKGLITMTMASARIQLPFRLQPLHTTLKHFHSKYI